RVARQIALLAANPDIRVAYLKVAYEIFAAFTIGAAVAIPVGIALGMSRYLFQVFNPIAVMLFGIPQITILPLFILFLGIGSTAKIAFGATHTVFPIIFTCIAGARSVDHQLLRATESMGASQGQVFRKLLLPSMLPWVVTGLRLGMASNLLGILLAELFISQKGVGFYVHQFTATFKSAETLGLVATLALFAMLLNEILRAFERRLSFWRG
ncbi:MAG: ABC transporter permease, partial [Chloroflexota bacterium]